MPLPGYKVREIIQKLMLDGDRNKDGKISFDEFVYVSIETPPLLGVRVVPLSSRILQ